MRTLLFRVGLRHLTAQPWRTLLVVLAVALGVTTFTAVQLINASTRREFDQAIAAVAGRAALQVIGSESGFPEELRNLVAGAPGVKLAIPLVTATAFVPETGDAVHVFGIDLLDEGAVRTYQTSDGETPVEDVLAFLNQRNALVVGAELAERLGRRVDDRLSLVTARGVQEFVIRGLLASTGPLRTLGGRFALMDIVAAQQALLKDGLVTQIDIVLDDGADVEQVRAAVAARLPATVAVMRPEQRARQLDRLLDSFQALLVGFSLIGVLLGGFVIFNSIAMAVGQRQREMGILRQIGARRRDIVGAVAFEGAILGLPGALLGSAFGIVAARVLMQSITQGVAAALALDFRVHHLEIPLAELVQVAAVGAAVGVLAAIQPALRAARTPPVDAAQPRVAPREEASRAHSVRVAVALVALLPVTTLLLHQTGALAAPAVYAAIVVSHVSLYVGLAMLAPLLVLAAGPVLHRTLPRLLGASGYLAWDDFVHFPRRTGATVTVLFTALSFLAMSGSLVRSFEYSVRTWADVMFPGLDLVFRSAHTLVGWSRAPFDDAVVREIAAMPGVEYAVGQRLVEMPWDGRRLLLQAVDFVPGCTRCGLYALRSPLGGGDRSVASRDVPLGKGVLVSDVLGRRAGLQVGDSFALETPRGTISLPILGIVPDYSSNEGSVIISRALYVERWGDRTISNGNIVVAEGADPEQVRAAVAQRLGISQRIEVVMASAKLDEIVGIIRGSLRFVYALEVLGLLVALLGLTQILLLGALERIRDAGILRAIGATRRQLTATVVVKGVMIGGIGAILGIAVGALLAAAWTKVFLAKVLGWSLKLDFPVAVVSRGMAWALLTAICASIVPARRVGRVAVAPLLRSE